MLSSLAALSLGQTSPLQASCASVKSLFQDNACCGAAAGTMVTDLTSVCPSIVDLTVYPKGYGKYNSCPVEELPATYSAGNAAVSSSGYTGCVAEDDGTPCGWYDYYTYDSTSGSCTTDGDITTAIQTVRGGSPTMTKDMIRLTGKDSLPTIQFPGMPMSYPQGRSPSAPEIAELEYTYKKFMTYYGSQLPLDEYTGYPTYGAEMGMVASVATKVLELARTTCTRNFYAYLEAPAYGYDWTQAISWVDRRASTFYAGSECSCATAGTCNDKGVITITQNGWAPARYPALPTAPGDDGVQYMANSTSPWSPWFQTNVIPGNPIGRFNECVTPEDRCLCDGVYFFPVFLAKDTVLKSFKCYSWAFSITKIYSAQLRGGMMFIKNAPATANSAASSIMGTVLSIANGLYSHMQSDGQIQIMNQMMSEPIDSATSWLEAMRLAQKEKWDVLDDAFNTCEAAGIVQRAKEQQKYFGAYVFAHMMPAWHGYSANVGSSSSDFFLSVIGYNHFNYNWGWYASPFAFMRGEDAAMYGIGENITSLDFHRIHTFRAYDVYAEEARRMKLVCSDTSAKVTSSLLSVNEWVALRTADLATGRRRLGVKTTPHARALEIQRAVPRMSLTDAVKHAELTDFNKELEWEYGLPVDLSTVQP
ncbi:MAG: hypothetical protein SGPRY_009077 [Prymnesium sp.]